MELVAKGKLTLDKRLIERATTYYDKLVNDCVPDTMRHAVNKTWLLLQRVRDGKENAVFNNLEKLGKASMLGAFKWWETFAGQAHGQFVEHIARRVLNVRCSAAATERANSTYSRVIGIKRNRMTNPRAEKVVYVYMNLRSLEMYDRAMELEDDDAVREYHRYRLPQLTSEGNYQDPELYGSLADERLKIVGSSFSVEDAVHEMFDELVGHDVGGEGQDDTDGADGARDCGEDSDLGQSEGDDGSSSDDDAEDSDHPEDDSDLEELATRQATAAPVPAGYLTPERTKGKRKRSQPRHVGKNKRSSSARQQASKSPEAPQPSAQVPQAIPGASMPLPIANQPMLPHGLSGVAPSPFPQGLLNPPFLQFNLGALANGIANGNNSGFRNG